VEHGARVVGEHHDPALAQRPCLLPGSGDQPGRSLLLAPERGKEHRGVSDRRVAGRLGHHPVFVHERRGGGEVAGEQLVAREHVEGELQLHERTAVASGMHLTLGNRPPGFEVPHLGGEDRADPAPAQPEQPAHVASVEIDAPDGLQCPGEQWRGSHVSVGEPDRERVQNQVDRPRWFASRRRGAGSLGRPDHGIGHVRAAGPDSGRQRIEVGLAREVGVVRLELSCRIQQQAGGVGVASLVERDLPAQVLDLGSTQRVGRRPRLQPAARGPQRGAVHSHAFLVEGRLRTGDLPGRLRRLDTESNGATVGAVTGALAGARGLPAEWIDRLRNRIDTRIPGFAATGFDERARRTAVLSTDSQ
jgi:hypothetical protein